MSRRRFRYIITLITSALLILAATLRGTVAMDDADKPIPIGAVDQVFITEAGMQRSYQIFRPVNVSVSDPLPLVIMLHGFHGVGKYSDEFFQWDRLASKEHFVVAYPSGVDDSWNAGGCCGMARVIKLDDVTYIEELARSLTNAGPDSAEGTIDPNRVYLAGFSNGGMLAYRIACQSSFRFAAIGSVAGALESDCEHATPTPLVEIHGESDTVVPLAGSEFRGPDGSQGAPPTESSIQTIMAADRCAPARTSTGGDVTTQEASCAEGGVVELVTVSGLKHEWPRAPRNPIDATSYLWSFFSRFKTK